MRSGHYYHLEGVTPLPLSIPWREGWGERPLRVVPGEFFLPRPRRGGEGRGEGAIGRTVTFNSGAFEFYVITTPGELDTKHS